MMATVVYGTRIGRRLVQSVFHTHLTSPQPAWRRVALPQLQEKIHLGHGSAQPGELKLVIETQISAPWFDSARPKVPMEKRHKIKPVARHFGEIFDSDPTSTQKCIKNEIVFNSMLI